MPTDISSMFVQSAMSNWEQSIKRATAIFDRTSDDQLWEEIAPGKNRVGYLLGHLTAVHDMMLPLMALGERQFPFLDAAFISNADRTVVELPKVQELRDYWKSANEILTKKMAALKPDEWLQKHTAVSDEDFAREPHRNRFTMLLGRTGHITYHLGQLALLKK